jgi:hypothetical protein
LAVYRAVRHRKNSAGEGALFLVLWVGATLLFFSAAVSKHAPYLLPLFPAAALLLALHWHDLVVAPSPSLRRGGLWSQLPVVGATSAALIYFWKYPQDSLRAKYGLDQTELLALVLMMAATVVFAYGLLWTKRYRASLAAMVFLVATGVVYFSVFLAPDVDLYRSTKQLSLEVDGMLPPGEKVAFYRSLKDSTLFYTDREAIILQSPHDLARHLALGPRQLCLLQLRDLKILGGLEDRWTVLDTVSNTALIRTAGNQLD